MWLRAEIKVDKEYDRSKWSENAVKNGNTFKLYDDKESVWMLFKDKIVFWGEDDVFKKKAKEFLCVGNWKITYINKNIVIDKGRNYDIVVNEKGTFWDPIGE